MSISDTAAQFFDACDSGKGWEGAKQCCSDEARWMHIVTGWPGCLHQFPI